MTQILDIMHFLFGLLLMKSLMENVSNYDSFENLAVRYVGLYKYCSQFVLIFKFFWLIFS